MTTRFFSLLTLAVAAIGLCAGCAGGKVSEECKVKGSDTMLNLTKNWAQAYEKANEGVKISVSGGGSGTGITALVNGTASFAMASRKIKDKEVADCKKAGFEPKEFVVARDGLAIIVHKSNPIDEISFAQLAKIFGNKDATNWRDVGGPDLGLIVFTRDSSSGTFDHFRKTVIGKNAKYREDNIQKKMQSNSQIIDKVIATKGGIGYAGLGYVEKRRDEVKILKVSRDGGAFGPTEASYPLIRNLYFYTKGDPTGIVKKFIDFARSEEGQKIVKAEGFLAASK